MNADHVVSLLRQHNSWRRGEEVPQLEPKEVGEAIDAAIEIISKEQKRIPLSFRWNHSTKPSLFEAWENGVLIYSGPYHQAPSIKQTHTTHEN